MVFPLGPVCRPQTDDGQRLRAKRRKDHADDSAVQRARGPPPRMPMAAHPSGPDDRLGKIEAVLQLLKIEPVLRQVGAPLRFVPDDPHRAICSYTDASSRAPYAAAPFSSETSPSTTPLSMSRGSRSAGAPMPAPPGVITTSRSPVGISWKPLPFSFRPDLRPT